MMPRPVPYLLACWLLAALPVAAGAQAPLPLELVPLDSPAPPASAQPNLAASADGRVYLSWIEGLGDGTHALRFAQRDSPHGAWSAPLTVVSRDDLFVNWADFPSLLVARSGRIVAHWLQKSGAAPYAYAVRIAQTTDGGRTWSDARVLHDDTVQGEHGFVSLIESPEGDVEAFWLDGRNAGEPHAHAEMQLGFTRVSAIGIPAPTRIVDPRTCDCCQTAAAWSATGPVVVYRDRSTEEIRDISILRRVDEAWSAPASVHADGWRIDGCPVNGPAIAAADASVAVAWYTEAGESPRVNLAFSTDSGASFAAPIAVDDGNPVGRVGVVLAGIDAAIVSWLERSEGEGAELRLRRISRDGTRSTPLVVARLAAARGSGFPRIVAAGGEIVVAWTETAGAPQVRVARVRP